MKKTLAIISVVFSVVFLAGCGQQQTSQTQPTTPAPVAQQPTATQPPVQVNQNWQIYTNDVYKYKFGYPSEAVIKEAQKNEFGMPTEELEKGITFDDILKKYTGKICVRAEYKDGTVYFSAPTNKDSKYVLCSGRTGVGSEAKVTASKENITIDGKTYSADTQDIVEDGGHNYLVYLNLTDGTRITLSSALPETMTTLKEIAESYSKIQ